MNKILLIAIILSQSFFCFAQDEIKLIDSKKVILDGFEYYNNKDYDGAIEKYDLVAKNDTNYLIAQYEKAAALSKLEKNQECVDICKNFLANKNNIGDANENLIYNLLGSTLDEMNKHAEALKYFDEGLRKYPEFTSLKLNKAITLKNAERYDDCVVAFKNLLYDNPNYANAHIQMGLLAADEAKNTQALLSFYMSTLLSMDEKKLYFLDSYAQGNLTYDSKGINLNKDSKTDNYDDIDLIIQNKVALSKGYKTPTSFDFPLVKQLYAILEQLEYDKNDEGFWMQFYVPYFKALQKDDQVDNMVHFLMAISTDESIGKKVQRYMPDMKDFYRWHLKTWSDLNGSAENTIMGEKGLYKRYYSDQKLTAIGNANNNNEAEGPWQYYHKNGKVMSYGLQKEGKREGTWNFFNENGTPESTYTYTADEVDGPYKIYDEFGLLVQTGAYDNGEIDGIIKNYYKDGTVAKQWNYEKGIITETSIEYFTNGTKEYEINYNEEREIDGEVKSYYPSGEKRSEMSWKDGSRNGKTTYYFVNGEISSSENYIDNELNGLFESFYTNKKTEQKVSYKDGKEIGESIEYFRSGDISAKYFFDENGKKNGIIEGYSPNGHKVYEMDYSKGDIAKIRHLDSEGNVVKEISKKGSKLNYEFIYDNGQIRSKGLLVKGKNEGLWTFFEKNGLLSSESNYKNDEKDGISKNYYPNGKLKSKMTYNEGLLDGIYKYYYQDEVLLKTGNYVKGLAQGEWRFYFENGKTEAINYYLDDEFHGYQKNYDLTGNLSDITLYDKGTIIERYTYDTLGVAFDTLYYNYGTVDAKMKDPFGNIIRDGKFINEAPEGKHIFYNGKNKKNVEAEYLNGERHGEWKWYNDGKLTSTATYVNGEITGTDYNYYLSGKKKSELYYDYDIRINTWKYYYENGQLKRDMPHQNNLRHGNSHYFASNGSLQYVKIHDNGYFIGYTFNDENGKLMEMIPIKNETVNIESFFANGKKSAEISIKNDRHDGLGKMYYENGQIETRINYKNGDNHGEYKAFYEDGTLKEEANYHFDNYHGKRVLYFANGNKKQELTYIHGIKFGKATFYNELGNKIKEQEFYDNQIANEIIF